MTKEPDVSNNLSNTLISELVHDLRKPFATFIMVVDMIMHTHGDLTQEELEALFEDIRCMTLKSVGLLDGLLYWMKSQKAGFTYESQPLVLSDLIVEANGLYVQDQLSKAITIYNIIPDHQLIYAQKEMLQFINRGILNKVTSHSPHGGIIGVTCSMEDDRITVAFTNQGSKLRVHQFKMLFNNDEAMILTNNQLKNAGITLSVCEDMIRKMSGKLWVESLPDQGIVFYYSLPVNLNNVVNADELKCCAK